MQVTVNICFFAYICNLMRDTQRKKPEHYVAVTSHGAVTETGTFPSFRRACQPRCRWALSSALGVHLFIAECMPAAKQPAKISC